VAILGNQTCSSTPISMIAQVGVELWKICQTEMSSSIAALTV
jgi:hypothetical protein